MAKEKNKIYKNNWWQEHWFIVMLLLAIILNVTRVMVIKEAETYKLEQQKICEGDCSRMGFEMIRFEFNNRVDIDCWCIDLSNKKTVQAW